MSDMYWCQKKKKWEPAIAISARNTCHIFGCDNHVVWLAKSLLPLWFWWKPGFLFWHPWFWSVPHLCWSICFQYYLLLYYLIRTLPSSYQGPAPLFKWPWMHLWQLHQHLQMHPIDLYMSSLHKLSQIWSYSILSSTIFYPGFPIRHRAL